MKCEHCHAEHFPDFWCNERTFQQYRKLVFAIVSDFIMFWGMQESEREDFIQSLMVKLCSAPQSYRNNSAGMYTILKNQAIKYLDRWKKRCLEEGIDPEREGAESNLTTTMVRLSYISGPLRRHSSFLKNKSRQ